MRYRKLLPGALISRRWTGNRWLRICICLSILVGLIVYGKAANRTVTLQMCLHNPEKYDGFTIDVGGEAQVVQVTEDWFTIRQMGRVVKVVGSHADIRPDEYVICQGVFHREGWLELIKVYVAVQRRYKILVSILPVMIVALLLLKDYGFDCSRFQFYQRRTWRT